jgi:hypothetical protein
MVPPARYRVPKLLFERENFLPGSPLPRLSEDRDSEIKR